MPKLNGIGEASDERPPLRGVIVALTTVALASGLTELLRSGLGSSIFFFFLGAVVITAQVGGYRSGFLAMVLSLVVTTLIYFEPRWAVVGYDETIRRCSLFAFNSLLIIALSEARWRAVIRERTLRRWYGGTLAGIGEAVISTDRSGRITYLNSMAEDLTGWLRAEAVGLPLDRVFRSLDESTRAAAKNSVDRVFREGNPVVPTGPILLRARDGGEIPIDQSVSPIRDDQGRITGIVLVFRDVSARKRTERELAESEARFRTFMDHSPIIAFIKDEQGRYVWGNAAWAARHRRPVGELLGLTDFELWPEEVAGRFRSGDQAALDAGATVELAEESRDREGHVSRLMTMKFPLPETSGRRLVGGIALDVTDRAMAEEALRDAKESAEAANRSKDRFLAVLSHELRTPLTPVLATVTAMLDEFDGSIDDRASVRATLELIRRSVELEARLIDDLLDVSRIVHGKLSLDRSPVDVHDLIHQTLGICRSDMNGRRMRLDLRLMAGRSVVDADPARLQQVLWNLIKNAVKFTHEGGAVAIRSRNIETVVDGESPRLEIQVRDSGIGIESEALPRIFDAFEQGDRAKNRRFGGLGLGLAISRSVVEAHGGKIEAESSGPGEGSTFTVTLATREAAAVDPVNLDREPPDRDRPLRILLVEDDVNTLRVLSRLLRIRGYEVTTADDVASACERFEESDFDLLLSDIGLPDGTGIDLMRLLKESRPLRGVALTGFGMDDDIRRCREAGFLAHLTKPVDFHKLEATIRQVASEAVLG